MQYIVIEKEVRRSGAIPEAGSVGPQECLRHAPGDIKPGCPTRRL